jgi:hypothetical protein
MQSLDSTFNELRERIGRGRGLNHYSFDPIYYHVFHPSKILDVKKKMTSWKAQLRKVGYNVHEFSISKEIEKIWDGYDLKDFVIDEESFSKDNLDLYKNTISQLVMEENPIIDRLTAVLEKASQQPSGVVFVTDLEALHPFGRIGIIEAGLQGKCPVPLIINYPGTRAGRTSLKFLGFYPEDGNYRSVHIGG